MSLAVLYDNAPKLLQDRRLEGTNPANYQTLEQYITFILLKGSPIQRHALIDNLDKLCDIAMPEIRQLTREPALALIETYLLQTCQILGCEFRGDLQTAVSMLYDDYSGLTIIEWARFFHAVAKGTYKTEYQHPTTRGLNMDFLQGWLEQFYEGRDYAIATLRKEMANREAAEPENPATIEQMRQVQRDATALVGLVHNWRNEYENNLTIRRMEKMTVVTTDDEGNKTTHEYEAPIEVDKDKAAYTRLYDFLSVYYGFKCASIRDLISELTIAWELERAIYNTDDGHSENFKPVEAPAFYRARAKSLLAHLRKFVNNNDRAILTIGLKELATAHPVAADFFKVLTGKEYTGDKAHVSVEPHLHEVYSRLIAEFYEQYPPYVRECIAAESFVLYANEYVAFRCIHHAVTVCGLEHPFTKIFNIEQQ